MSDLITILNGDCRQELKGLADESVHCVVTSPPYFGLRDYQVDGQIGLEQTPQEYIETMVEVFREVRRVLRNDGTLWLNLGDSYAGGKTNGPEDTANSGHWSNRNQRRDRKAPGIKNKDLIGIPWMLAFALRADGWYLRSDIIWCLSGGTRVYARTQKGEMPMPVRDLSRLDPSTVELWNGEKWTRLLGVSLSGRKGDELEITLRSGEKIACTPSHKFPTHRGIVEAKELTVGDVVLTCKLPEPEVPVDPRYLPDDLGWFVGLYLAEGSKDSKGTIQIASHVAEQERFERLKRLAHKYGAACRVYEVGGKSAVACITSKILSAVLDTYLTGRTAHDKHLSNKCWQRSDRFLEEILLGYLEGDGHFDSKNDRWRLGFTRNYLLAADLRTLCARIKVRITLTLSTASIGEKVYQTFRGEVRFNLSGHHNTKESGEIVAIGKANARQFYDIGVEDDPHLFALASGVLTHNSKPNPMPESVTDRPTRSHEYIFLLSKSARYFYDAEAIKEQATNVGKTVSLGEKSFSKGQANGKGIQPSGNGRSDSYTVPSGRNRRSVWTVATQPYAESHFATFPPDLIKPCILAGTSARGCCVECGAPYERILEPSPEYAKLLGKDWCDPEQDQNEGRGHFLLPTGEKAAQRPVKRNAPSVTAEYITVGWKATCNCFYGPAFGDVEPCTVLDPFGGSGTTGKVAVELRRKAILIELNSNYIPLIEKRCATQIGLGI